MKGRRGLFGVAGGLWLLRKTKKHHHHHHHRSSTEQSVEEGITDSGCNKKISQRLATQAPSKSMTPNITTTTIRTSKKVLDNIGTNITQNIHQVSSFQKGPNNWIGWDDERCCAVYHTTNNNNEDMSTSSSTDTTTSSSHSTTLISSSDEDNDDKDSVMKSGTKNEKKNRLVTDTRYGKTDTMFEGAKCHAGETIPRARRKTKNGFGCAANKGSSVPVTTIGRRRLSSYDNESDIIYQHQKKRRCRTATTTSEKLIVDNTTIGTKRISQLQSIARTEKATNEKKLAKISVDSRCNTIATTTTLQLDCHATIPDYCICQPGHTTPLDVARAFFSRIDSDPSLLIVECSKSPTPLRRRVTTTRGNLPSPLSKAEYQDYCNACQEANIPPLSRKLFMLQRSKYFRTDEVFDGMFDD